MCKPATILAALTATALASALCVAETRAAPGMAVDDDAPARLVELLINANAAEDPKPAQPFGPPARNFRAKLGLLRRIAHDPSVDGVMLDLQALPSWAHTLDLLDELAAIRASGKTVVCYSEVLDQRNLMAASLSDLLVVPPSGMIGLEGLTAEVMYYKDLLARFDIGIEVMHVGDYKSAYEQFSRGEMSDPLRETIGDMLDEYYGQMVDTIATNREISRETLEGLFADVLVTPAEAAEAGLIDAAVYRDEFDGLVRVLVGGEFVVVKDYGDDEGQSIEELFANPFAMMANLELILNPRPVKAPDEPHVAVVYATGPIASGKSKADMQGNVASMGSETIVAALEAAADDDDVKAVVLRVNSPGGSALASDMIWRAVQKTRERKPVIASMGSVAASGGYWISMGCDVIMAQPSTITGSIGVVSMLPDLSKTLAGVGVHVDVVSRGPNGDQLAFMRNGVTPLLREVITRSMSVTYDEFLTKVAEGRGLERAAVAQLAQGRVWTGRQAESNGLVDALGGLDDAINLAFVMGGGLDPATTPVAEYPPAPNFFEQLEESMQGMARAPMRSALQAMADELGYGDVAVLAGRLMERRSLVDADTVQAFLPIRITIR